MAHPVLTSNPAILSNALSLTAHRAAAAILNDAPHDTVIQELTHLERLITKLRVVLSLPTAPPNE